MKIKKETHDVTSLLNEIKTLKKRIKNLESASRKSETGRSRAAKNSHSSDFLQTIIDSIPAPLFFKNARGIYELCNSAFEDYLGMQKEKIIGRTVYEIAPRHLADEYNTMDLELLKNGGIQIYESNVKFCDQSLHDVIFNKTCVYDRRGNAIGLIGVLLDISERKKAEAEILKSEELYRALAESSSDMIYVVDYDGKVLYVNEAAAANFDIHPLEAVGRYLHDLFTEDISQRQLSIIKKIFDSGIQQRIYEQKSYFKDREIWIDALFTPIKNEKGGVVSVLGISRDISDRIKMQQDILNASKLESLGVLAGGIAHDFNNALMAIIGNIILAKNRAGGDKKLLEILGRAESVTCKAKNLTKQFITFSGGGAPVRKICRDLNALVKEVTHFIMCGSEINYKIEAVDNIPAVAIDEGQICHALTNIIINARQAVKNNGEVTVRLSHEDVTANSVISLSEGLYVKISVTDNGPGIPKEIHHKIFDPYFTTRHDRSGLGLSASYSIAKNHGGIITFSTAEKKGTTFNLYIPRSEAAPAKSKSINSKIRRDSGSEKILIMDDDEAVLLALCEILTELGYTVKIASSHEQAVNIFEIEFGTGRGFDAAILDLVIKEGCGGIETLAELKKIDPLVKSIVSSGYTRGSVISNYGSYGFDAMLAKPYQKEDILNALNGIFGGEFDENNSIN